MVKNQGPAEVGAFDFQAETESKHGEQFGWYVHSQPDPTKEHYGLVDHMYLLEWVSGGKGQTGQPAQATVHLGKNIGGWPYGHWDISLNSKSTIYAIALKTVIGGGPWHEGAVTYAINREDWTWNREMGGGWGGCDGHVLENRLTFNTVSETWARFWGSDERNFWSRSICFGTMPGTMENVYHIPPSKSAQWLGNGGPFNMVSRGEQGWLGIMSAPDPTTLASEDVEVEELVVGLVQAPLDAAECANGACKPRWLTNFTVSGQNSKRKLGMLNLQSLGPAGADARLLMGWANVQTTDSTGLGGISDEYRIAEIDSQGNRKSKAQLLEAGWGEDNTWASLPELGCVAWAYTWHDEGMARPYGNRNFGHDVMPGTDQFSNILRLSVVCPS